VNFPLRSLREKKHFSQSARREKHSKECEEYILCDLCVKKNISRKVRGEKNTQKSAKKISFAISA
jgi:hypothetical protein